MKKTVFSLGVATLGLVALFILYGIYINRTSDSHIETMLRTRAVRLSGHEVRYRDIHPEISIDYAVLRTAGQADAIAQVDGTIEEMYVTQGQEVEPGQKLCKIRNDGIELELARAETGIAKANVAYRHAKGAVEKYSWLVSRDSISKGELENARTQMQAAKAELDASRIVKQQLEQQQRLQVVTSPLAGTVLVMYRQAGNFVSKGSPVLMVTDFRKKMFLTTQLDDAKVKNLAPLDGEFTFHMDLFNMTEKALDTAITAAFDENTAFDVRIRSVSPPVEMQAPKRTVLFEIDNEKGIMEFGIYMHVLVRRKAASRVLAVPLYALVGREKTGVYVRDENSRLALRKVETGVFDAGFMEVKGLREGDIVITSSVEGLDVGDRIDVFMEEED